MVISRMKRLREANDRIDAGGGTEEDYRSLAYEYIEEIFVSSIILFLLSCIFIGTPIAICYINLYAGIGIGILINIPVVGPWVIGKYLYWKSQRNKK
jgi:hypothetical protein